MRLDEHYIALLLALPDPEPGRTLSLGVEEVAQKLRCTPRNANLLLKRMADQGLLSWQAGVGRGNRSRMTIQAGLSQALPHHFGSLLRRGDVDRAAALLRDDRVPLSVREQLYETFQRQFGLRSEMDAGGPRDVLKMPLPYKVGSLDPARLLWVTESWVSSQVFDSLCRFDPESQTVVPQVAHTWDRNETATEWQFHLRKGVRYHSGKAVTARDVIHSLDRLAGSPAAWLLHGFQSVSALGDYVVRIRLESPNLLLPHLLANASAAILPADLAWNEKKVIGTGPFRVAERGEFMLVLEAFDGYFQGRPLLDRVELWTVPESAVQRHYEVGDSAGSLHRAPRPGADLHPAAREHEVFEQGCQFVAFDYRCPGPQQDPTFRRAMRLVLDRVAWVLELGEERIAPAAGFSPRRSARADWPETTDGRGTDEVRATAEARAWLESSAYRGEPLHLYYKPTQTATADAEWLVRRCEAIGIRIVPHSHLWSGESPSEEAPALHMGSELFGADETVSFVQMLAQEGSAVRQNLMTHWAEELGRFRDLLYAAEGPADRDLIAAAFEEWLAEDCKLLCNYHVRKRVGTPAALQGFQPADFGLPDLRRLWIKPTPK